MNDELERIWKEVVVAHSSYCHGICLEEPKIFAKALRIAGVLAEIRTRHLQNKIRVRLWFDVSADRLSNCLSNPLRKLLTM
jgi:hypothetical protein